MKDLADLHRDAGKNFKPALRQLMQSAKPAGGTLEEGSSRPKLGTRFVQLSGSTLDRLREQKLRPIDAVPTPLPTWNAACRDEGGGTGLARSWHITAAAKTGNGKSLFAGNLAHYAVMNGEVVCFISLEMSQAQLTTRFLSIASGERISALEKGRLFDIDAFDRATAAVNAIQESTGGVVFCNERPISLLSDITDAIRHHHEYHGCRYVITDYLQLAEVSGVRDPLEGITAVSHEVRKIAADLNIVSIGLSQFNRETSKDREHSPTPQGLMGGSALENDSDQVLLFDHTKMLKTPDGATTSLLLAKNRHGPQKDIPVEWDWSTLRLTERIPPVEAAAPTRSRRDWQSDDREMRCSRAQSDS